MTARARLPRQSGLTLIELLVVIALLVVLAGLGTLNLTGWNCRQNVRNDLLDLSGGISYLQSIAGNANRSMLLRSSVDGTLVSYAYYQANDTGIKEHCTDGLFSSSKWSKIDRKTELDGTLIVDPGLVCFHADGSVNDGTTKHWTLGKVCGPSSEEVKYQITTHGSTGFVEEKKFNTSSNRWEEM